MSNFTERLAEIIYPSPEALSERVAGLSSSEIHSEAKKYQDLETAALWTIATGGMILLALSKLAEQGRQIPQEVANTGTAAAIFLIMGGILWFMEISHRRNSFIELRDKRSFEESFEPLLSEDDEARS